MVGEPLPIEVGDRLLGGGIVDDHPTPILIVSPVPRLKAQAQAFLDDRPLDRATYVEALPNRSRGGQQLVDAEVQLFAHPAALSSTMSSSGPRMTLLAQTSSCSASSVRGNRSRMVPS